MKWPRLPEGDLPHDPAYARQWRSIVTSSFGNKVMMLALALALPLALALALPLTAAVLLQATPTQMGLLTAIELSPFLIFSLPSGVWLDRVRKLPVYVWGESLMALCAISVPVAWWMGWLTRGWLYGIGFVIGVVHTVAGTAAQIALTQVVARDRLLEAHAKNAFAILGARGSGAGAGRCADQGVRRAAGTGGERGAAAGQCADPSRHSDPVATRRTAPRATRSGTSAATWRWACASCLPTACC